MTKKEHLKLIQEQLAKIEEFRAEHNLKAEEFERAKREYDQKCKVYHDREAAFSSKLDDLMGDLEVLIINSRSA